MKINYNGRRLRVLISAYACEPDKGSEPGVGWNWSKEIAQFAEVWVITRANNRNVIEEELKKNPQLSLHFIYVDLPKWLRFWKKGQRGVQLYYYLWQFAAYLKAQKLIRETEFGLAHHITFVNDWMPSLLSLLPVPFIWGPIGSHPPVPLRFLHTSRAKILEVLRRFVQAAFRALDPLFYITLFKAHCVIAINGELKNKYPFKLLPQEKFFCHPAIGTEISIEENFEKKQSNKTRVISVGRLVYFKGFHLILEAFAAALKTDKAMELFIVGEGTERKSLEALTYKLGITKEVTFCGKIPRDAVLKKMAETDIFILLTFEGGAMAVLEAMAQGLPVICLDYGGPKEFVTQASGIKIKPVTAAQTAKDTAGAIIKLSTDSKLRKELGEAGKNRVKQLYTWEAKREFIQKIYESVTSA